MIATLAQAGVRGNAFDHLLADLAYASGNLEEAVVRYRAILKISANQPAVCERAAIASLKLNRPEAAKEFFPCATDASPGSWRGWNALGVLSDLTSDWGAADAAYAKALELAPATPAVLNNLGYSKLLRGEWEEAERHFAAAAQGSPTISRIANNLELARAALARDLPRRQPGESDSGWASRLNDAGVAASILGDRARAIAAFTQALEASGIHYARAANNLDTVQGK